MVSGKDILMGIQAFKTMSDTMKGDAKQDMYRYLMNRRKKMDQEYADAYKRGSSGQYGYGFPSAQGGTGSYPQGNYGSDALGFKPSMQTIDGSDGGGAISTGGLQAEDTQY